mgnify:CR=1 FL=1
MRFSLPRLRMPQLSLPRLRLPRLPGMFIFAWLFAALKGWVMGSRPKDNDSLVMYDRMLLWLTFGLAAIGFISMAILLLKWKDLMVTFFDEHHARSIGLNTRGLKLLFFTLLAACTVAALQTVGAFLVICLVVTPGATAWLLTDRFPRLLAIAVAIGSLTSFFGAWLSYYLDGATGGIIVVAQTLLFLITFIFAPKHGLLASRRRAREAAC